MTRRRGSEHEWCFARELHPQVVTVKLDSELQACSCLCVGARRMFAKVSFTVFVSYGPSRTCSTVLAKVSEKA